ncbi:hypothetical protein [Antribacter gilvus]|uniref:hypothetical protein n=1 Tax=Antribacter gilvus TaxID=2304675 RepID=UPI000F7B313A|nr:hypothetical protein [Antribacter gilvus]
MSTRTDVVIARETNRDALLRALNAGELERIRRGVYRAPLAPGADRSAKARDAYARAIDRARGLHRQLRAEHRFSHETAALLLGAPLWRPPVRTHVIQGYRPSSRAARDVARHVTDVPSADQVEAGGLPVTSLARTVVDCAMTLHPLEALVVADWAMENGLDLGRARALLAQHGEANGIRRAALVLDLTACGAQSVWETWLRYVLLRAGFPPPQTQAPVQTRLGLFHVDMGWKEWRVGVEFDGQVKYTDGAFGAGHDGRQALIDEKRRGDAVRERWTIVRVTAYDRPDDVVARVARHLPAGVRESLRVNPLLPPPS